MPAADRSTLSGSALCGGSRRQADPGLDGSPSTLGTISEESAQLHEDFNYLSGKSIEELRVAELEGTVAALQSAGRPVSVVRFEALDEAHLGAWILLMKVATVMAADHLKVDPFDQPGVEGGKRSPLPMGKAG